MGMGKLMNRSLTRYWVAAACVFGAMASPVSATALVYGGTPTVPVSRPGGFVPQIMYMPSRPPPLLTASPLTVSGPAPRAVDMGVAQHLAPLC